MKTSLGRAAFLLGALTLSCALGLFLDLPTEAEGRAFVLTELRLPRTLIGLLVGAVLGSTGAAFQALFRNPLATPSTVGTTAGASLFALFALALPSDFSWLLPTVTLFAFGGALVTTLIVAGVAARGRVRVEEVLLAGVAVSLAAGSISQAMHLVLDSQQVFAAAQWSLGHLPQVGYDRVFLLLGPAALTVFAILWRRQAIALSAFGEDYADSLGIDTRRLRLEVLIFSCIGLGASVALTGPILFVGLIVPHLIMRLLIPAPGELLPLSALGGSALLVASDLLGRELIPGREIPVGVITAGIGAPLLFYLVARPWGRPRG
jgi:iron complex transport system permease protein